MKKFAMLLAVVVMGLCAAGDAFAGYVRGYYRKDRTYVRPHYRSKPDGIKWNNYGSPSYSQRKKYKHYPVLPSYRNDYDSDGIWNQFDLDDDNDGILDDLE